MKGEDPGYTVHISADLEVTTKRLKQAGYGESDMLFTLTRLNRMNPAPGSTNLELFKKRYRDFKTYFLIPAVLQGSGMPKPIPELGIFKSKVLFRHVDDVKATNDIDLVVIQSGGTKRPPNPDYPKSKKRRPRS